MVDQEPPDEIAAKVMEEFDFVLESHSAVEELTKNPSNVSRSSDDVYEELEIIVVDSRSEEELLMPSTCPEFNSAEIDCGTELFA